MSSSATITIVTPTLNAEAYLAECLASIAAQQIPELQHIIVDGGSTDRTAEIARAHAKVEWISAPGLRQSAAINAGIRMARGDVVAWLNADDLYEPGALDTVLRRFADIGDLDVLYGDCRAIGPNGDLLWWERPGAYDFYRMLRRGNYLPQPAVFLRRRVFDELGYLDESLDYGMDYDLWLRLRHHRVAYLPRPLASFRWHPKSKSARGQLQSWSEFLRIVRRYGGGWTPRIAWAYARCLITIARIRLSTLAGGRTPGRPVTRGA